MLSLLSWNSANIKCRATNLVVNTDEYEGSVWDTVVRKESGCIQAQSKSSSTPLIHRYKRELNENKETAFSRVGWSRFREGRQHQAHHRKWIVNMGRYGHSHIVKLPAKGYGESERVKPFAKVVTTLANSQ